MTVGNFYGLMGSLWDAKEAINFFSPFNGLIYVT